MAFFIYIFVRKLQYSFEMKIHKKITIVILFSAGILTGCSTQKATTSQAKGMANRSVSQTAVTIEEPKTLNEGEITKMNYFAEEMALLQCEIKNLDKKLNESPNNDVVLQHKRELEQKFSDYDQQVQKYFTTQLQKQEFNRVYHDFLNKCM